MTRMRFCGGIGLDVCVCGTSFVYQKMLVDRTEAANRIGDTIKAEISTQNELVCVCV